MHRPVQRAVEANVVQYGHIAGAYARPQKAKHRWRELRQSERSPLAIAG